MKLRAPDGSVERFNTGAESVFTIKTSPRAFDILSSALYTDKIMAIIRELSCNAYDAHVSVDKGDIPFDIHLPNVLDPQFVIRDYGPGLSNSDIHTLYTTYFDSTKTDSNNFIGALGLGSKSPFSYTKYFTVTSRYEGVKSVYVAFINEDGIPTISDINSTSTEEPSGLEITIPTLRQSDCDLFKHKLKEAFLFFPVKPTVSGIGEDKSLFTYAYERLEDFSVDNKFHILKSVPWFSYPRSSVVQGNVYYPLNIDLLDGLLGWETNLLKKIKISLFFDLGDINISASRENIQYDQSTKNTLYARIREMCRHLSDVVIAGAVKKHKDSYWNLAAVINSVRDTLEINNLEMSRLATDSLEILKNQDEYNILDRYIKDDGRISVEEILLSNQIQEHNITGYAISYSSAAIAKLYRTRKVICNRNRGPEEYTKDNVANFINENYLHPYESRVVIYSDLRAHGIGAALQYAIENKKLYVYLITKRQKSKDPVKIANDKKAILRLLGNPPFVDAKDILPAEITARKTRQKGTKNRFYYVYSITDSYSSRIRSALLHHEIDSEKFGKGGYYIPIIRTENAIQMPLGNRMSLPLALRQKIMSVVHLLNTANVLNKDQFNYKSELIAVPKTYWPSFSNSENWINLIELIQINKDKVSNLIESYNGLTSHKVSPWKQLCVNPMFLAYFGALEETSLFKKEAGRLIEAIKLMNEKSINDLCISNAYSYFSICKYIDTSKTVTTFSSEKLKSDYPLIEIMNIESIAYSLRDKNTPQLEEFFKYLMAADKCRLVKQKEII